MIDLLLHNLRTIGTHHCDGTVGEEAADEIERLQAEVAELREWLEADARCPCCDTVDACLDDCTFATDCPQDAGRMAEVRALLAARKGEAC